MIVKTSIHESYQSKVLDLLWCLRELGANGIDGEERNKSEGKGAFQWSYSKRSGTVEFINWGVKVPVSALLMGTSESRSEDECIGEFGEGLPLTLKQLKYLDYEVEIFNRDEKWTPKLEAQPEFDGARILTVGVRSVKDRGGFIVRVKGVPEAEWHKLETLFLKSHPTFNPEEVASGYYDHQQVLLQPEFKGKVYNKGVFVLEREDLLFGYNLITELNRDRALMSDFELRDKVGDVLNDAVRQDCDFQDTLILALFCGDNELELQDFYSSLQYRSDFRKKCIERFYEWYGEKAVPVATEEEVKQASQMGLDGIVIPKTLRSILEGDIDSLQERMTCFANSVQQEVDLNQMAPETYHTFDKVKDLMRFALPDWSFSIKIVEFGGSERAAHLTDTGEVQVARWVVEKGESELLKAIAKVAPKEDETTTDLLCRLITKFTENY